MYNIKFTQKSRKSIINYSENYRKYFKDLYADSGLWNEKEIIKFYKLEAKKRRTEITLLIQEKLSNEFPSYSKNEAILKWRTKILLVSFIDIGKDRIITDLEIR